MTTAIIWDLDGVLVDSLGLRLAGLRNAAIKAGTDVPNDGELQRLLCHGPRHALQHIPGANTSLREFESFCRGVAADHIGEFPGIGDAMRDLERKGLKQGLVTSRTVRDVRRWLNLCRVPALFDVTITYSDRLPSKPRPEGLIEAAVRLGIAPADTAYVGDTIEDGVACERAGIPFLLAGWGAPDIKEIVSVVTPAAIAEHPSDIVVWGLWESRMIAFSDEQRVELGRGMLARGDYDGAIKLLRTINVREARQLLGAAAYSYGKILISKGQYGASREFFTQAMNHHESPAVRRMARERNQLIRRIESGQTNPVTTMLEQFQNTRLSEAVAMHPETFAPLISYVGCPAAYRSGYDPERSDPLSRLIRRVKRGTMDSVATAERQWAVERLGEIVAAYAYAETSVLEDIDFIVPVPSDRQREAERRYSIPMILASKMAMSCAIPLCPEVVETAGPLPDLRQIPRWARSTAISDAYAGTDKADILEGMTVALVDDVVTTGATLNEVALVLKGFGARDVVALLLAHTESSF